jgi:iron(III) transport system ATP-binding protein
VTAVVELSNVHYRYAREDVLCGVSLQLAEGETLALVGPSGAGKSSLVRLVLGLAAPNAGTIKLGGRLASEPGRLAIAPEDRGLGVVFQDLALWPHMTVERNLGFALGCRDRAPIGALLDRVGLAGKAARYPGELSGGERQRVAIARALVTSPAALILDEPLSSLDVVLARELIDLLRELLRERAALYVTHEPREVALAHRVAVLEAGTIVQIGTPAELRAQPATPFVEAIARDLG